MLEYSDQVLQAHLERISDYIACGAGIWWHREGDFIVFHDGDEAEDSKLVGPEMMHFQSASLQDVYAHLEEKWIECINTNIEIPIN